MFIPGLASLLVILQGRVQLPTGSLPGSGQSTGLAAGPELSGLDCGSGGRQWGGERGGETPALLPSGWTSASTTLPGSLPTCYQHFLPGDLWAHKYPLLCTGHTPALEVQEAGHPGREPPHS